MIRIVIASAAKQSRLMSAILGCFVARLLAMTAFSRSSHERDLV